MSQPNPPAISPTTLHDARTGFYDIKPVQTAGLPLGPALLVLLLLLAALLYRKFRKPPTDISAAPLSTGEEFQLALKQLAARTLSDAQRASALSLLLRSFLGDELKFAGVDCTRREILHELRQKLPSELPRQTEEFRTGWHKRLDALLRELELISFGSTHRNPPDWDALLDSTESVFVELHAALERERLRRQPVVAAAERNPGAPHAV